VPEATVASLNLPEDPGLLEARRREIVSKLQTDYHGFDDPNVPISLLHELAAITGRLRRKTSGPPKETKSVKLAKRVGPTSIDDLMV